MNINNFTIKAQELLQQAQQIAFNNQNPNIETQHLLKAMLSDKEGSIEYILKKSNGNINLIEKRLDESISKIPKITNGDLAQNISREVNNAMLKTANILSLFGDEFVSPEHLLIALIQGNDETATILKEGGLSEKDLIAAIKELRKGETVSSQTSDSSYNNIEKYSKN